MVDNYFQIYFNFLIDLRKILSAQYLKIDNINIPVSTR